MEENTFQDYYDKIKERDQEQFEKTPLPEPSGNNVWTIFGLSFGIASIAFGFIFPYVIILALFSLVISGIGYGKKVCNLGKAAIICSVIDVIISLLALIPYFSIL